MMEKNGIELNNVDPTKSLTEIGLELINFSSFYNNIED